MSISIPELIISDNIHLRALSQNDAQFMYELMNTADWIEFIGSRNIIDTNAASEYIRKVENSDDINFWVILPMLESKPVGVVTIIKKEYLDFPDIGFALLPAFYQRGFAFNAAKILLSNYFTNSNFIKILATSLKHNLRSIGLLTKLGFKYEKEIIYEGETMNVYSTNNVS
jgi:ribosomal-protein-alanine N-acetyltransferase